MFAAGQEIRMSELRKALVERVRADVKSHGLTFDDDPRFLEIERRWVIGDITLAEFRRDYLELLFQRQEEGWLRRALQRSRSE